MTTLYRIYGIVDQRDKNGMGPVGRRLLYVGITDHYDQRMQQHAEKRWWTSITKITREEFADREAAVKAEALAIATENPLYNVVGTKNKATRGEVPRASRAPRPADRTLSLAEASEYLGVCTKTLRRYISAGDLPAGRIRGSRLIRVKRSDLDALLVPIPTVGG